MSLYWVARLPIERPKPTSPLRPKEQTSRASPGLRVAPAARRRHWKIALSLAVVAGLAAPFVFRTYKARPIEEVWVPLTAEERENLAAYRQRFSYCENPNVVVEFNCYRQREKFKQGGDYEYRPDLLTYLQLNGGVAAVAFLSVFGLAFAIPMFIRGIAVLARRYWKWLNA